MVRDRGVSLSDTSIAVRHNELRSPEELRELLWTAVERGNVHGIETALARGAKVNRIDPATGDTALHIAASTGDVEVAECLLAAAADINFQNKSLQTPLHKAAYEGRDEIVDVLLTAKDIDLDSRNEHGLTALHWAVVRSRAQIAKRLLDARASVDIRDENGDRAADVAEGPLAQMFQTFEAMGTPGSSAAESPPTPAFAVISLETEDAMELNSSRDPLHRKTPNRLPGLSLDGVPDPLASSGRQCSRKCEACCIA